LHAQRCIVWPQRRGAQACWMRAPVLADGAGQAQAQAQREVGAGGLLLGQATHALAAW